MRAPALRGMAIPQRGRVRNIQLHKPVCGRDARIHRCRADGALAQVYGQLQRQASMLAYKNAFFILARIVMCLSSLVWIMRLPPKRVAVDPEQLAAH